ncbi:MAG TPA: molybdopterin-dependent oxidoreductase [Desulfomonilaceae bacterium]|nr:molybdopterin-dependent oxidoreductase [Desulfomonilaceae bacterium]
MVSRRKFMGLLAAIASCAEPLVSGFLSLIGKARAENVKKMIPAGTRREDLVHENPADLDSSRLEITPLEEFGTMGLEDYQADMNLWRLLVDGEVEEPLELDYPTLKRLPWTEKSILMICRGFFVNNGLWKGVSTRELLRLARPRAQTGYILVQGPPGNYKKVEKFSLEEALSDRLLLCYQVNGATLPVKHGFPIRLAADGFWGDQWVKFVYKITVT